jgi:bifunctional oligoribonuclease and PAP phosphatase NrnA
MTNTEFKEQFFSLADQAQHIAITSHISPDDDSIGSVLSMYAILSERFPGKDVRIIYTGQKVERYNIFHNFEKIEWVDDVANHLDGIDMLVMLDASKYERFSKNPERLKAVPVTIAIDHHASEPHVFTLLLFKTEFSANCELVYRTFLEGQDYSKELAELILLGILGDTGGFAHIGPQQTDVFALGGELVKRVGIPVDQFRSRYMGIPINIIPLLQELVKNMEYKTINGWPPAQYTHISRSLYEQGGYTDEDMSAASHIYMSQYLTRIRGYSWGFVITPRSDGGCRMSSRSLPESVNVRDLSERLGIGGGHDRASGGNFKDCPEPVDCIAKVLQFMETNKPQIL